MGRKSIMDKLPAAIKDEVITKFLERETYREISQWLLSQHGIKAPVSTLNRPGIYFQDKFSPLINLGMPIAVIVKNRFQIEAKGVDRVRQELLDKLTKNDGAMFAYLGDEKTTP